MNTFSPENTVLCLPCIDYSPFYPTFLSSATMILKYKMHVLTRELQKINSQQILSMTVAHSLP